MPSTVTSVELPLREQGVFQLIKTIKVCTALTEKQANNFTNNAAFCILCPKCLQFPGLIKGEKGKPDNPRISEPCQWFQLHLNPFPCAASAQCWCLYTHLLLPCT